MKKRKLILLALTIGLICLAPVVGVFLYSAQSAEQRLQDYIRRLEDAGFTTEERSLRGLNVDDVMTIRLFGDFRSYASQRGIGHVYFDRGLGGLYFLNLMEGRLEANVFYYK